MPVVTPTPAAPLLGRIGTAMVTPFTADGALDETGAAAVAEHLVALGSDLLVVSGTTGEATTTTDTEKDQLLRAVHDAVGARARVLAGVGTADTAHSVELARAAAAAGADGLLLVAPYYARPSQDGVLAHIRAVADATDLPVMLYDIPGRTGCVLTVETLLRAAEHPRVRAVKDATGSVPHATAVMAATDLDYYSGTDELNLALLAAGAVGIVSVVGHVAAGCYAELAAAVRAGDLPRARSVDRALLPVVAALMDPGPGAVTAKAALQLRGVLAERTTRLPYLPASVAEVERVATALTQLPAARRSPVAA